MKRKHFSWVLGFILLLLSGWLLVLWLELKPVFFAEITGKQGDRAFAATDYGDAEVFYHEAATLHPESNVRYNLANSYYQQGRTATAIKTYEQLLLHLELEPKRFQIFYNLGHAYFIAGDTLKSLKAFEQALLLNEKDTHTRQNFLHVYQAFQTDRKKQKSDPNADRAAEKQPEGREKEGDEEKGKSARDDQNQNVELSEKNMEELLEQIRKNEETVRGKINASQQINPKVAPGERDY